MITTIKKYKRELIKELGSTKQDFRRGDLIVSKGIVWLESKNLCQNSERRCHFGEVTAFSKQDVM